MRFDGSLCAILADGTLSSASWSLVFANGDSGNSRSPAAAVLLYLGTIIGQVTATIRPVGPMLASIHPGAALSAILQSVLTAPSLSAHVEDSPSAVTPSVFPSRPSHCAACRGASLRVVLFLRVRIPILQVATSIFPIRIMLATRHTVAALSAILGLLLHCPALPRHVVVPAAAPAVILDVHLAASGTRVVQGSTIVAVQGS